MLLSNSRFKSFFLCSFFLMAMLFLQNCASVFSEMQSAKLVGKNKSEITASYSSVSVSEDGESESIQDHVGVQAAYGVSENVDLRVRYEHITVDISNQLPSLNVNVLGFGPKFNLVQNQVSFYLPLGFAFGDDINDSSESWEMHPTLLFTYQAGNNFEINPSAKALVPLNRDSDVLFAFNIGAGISSDLSTWALRPEIGFLYNPGEDGYFMHYSIGLSIYP